MLLALLLDADTIYALRFFFLTFIVAPLVLFGAVLLVRRLTGSTGKALLRVLLPLAAVWLIYQLAKL